MPLTYAAIQRIPSSHLRASLEDIRQSEGDYTQNRIMLPVPRVTDGHSHNTRSPVTHESFSTSVEDGLAAYDL